MREGTYHSRVRFEDAWWGPRVEVNRLVFLPEFHSRLRTPSRLERLRVESGGGPGNDLGMAIDGELPGWMVAAACSLRTHPDPSVEAPLEHALHALLGAQQADGFVAIAGVPRDPARRWSVAYAGPVLRVCARILEAAAAHFEASGTTLFLDVGRRLADCVAAEYLGGRAWREGAVGDPAYERALLRFFRVTGEGTHLEAATLAVERRREWLRAELEQVEGGATEANVLGRAVGVTGVLRFGQALTELARLRQDDALLADALRLWSVLAREHLYVTGALGVSDGSESFGRACRLPNEMGGGETVASVEWARFCHGLLLATGEGRFADEMERALYNTVAGAVTLDGRRLACRNPLSWRADGGAGWQAERCGDDCFVCASAVAEMFATLGGYVLAEAPDEITVQLYARCEAVARVCGREVVVQIETEYPDKGDVRIRLDLAEPAEFTLRLRLPVWCPEALLTLNGKSFAVDLVAGHIPIRRVWQSRDEVLLRLRLPTLRVYADPRVAAAAGRVAIQRGPVVFCVEGVDVGLPLDSLSIPAEVALRSQYQRRMLGGVTTVQVEGSAEVESRPGAHLYRTQPVRAVRAPLFMVPFAYRGNRERAEMDVWIRETVARGLPPGLPPGPSVPGV